MELQELYHLIDLQPEMVQKLESVRESIPLGIDIESIEPYLEQLMDIESAAQSYDYLKKLFQDDQDHLKMLYCQLECARRVFARYQEKHIPKDIYVDTMRCFTRFIEECKKKNGRMFFDRGWWTYRQTSMNIFRIGELEYQFDEHKGENVIGLHIPSDADLSKEAVDRSLEQAEIFFRTYYSDFEYEKYTCESWLLSPALKLLLPPKSNILSFQDRFNIIQEDKEDKEYIEWLFQVPLHTPYKDLPEVTSLQKKGKELLLNGGAIGSAYGIMKR